MTPKFELTEQNYRYLFDNASDAMWVHDADGNILVANKASEKLTGYTHDELARMNIIGFLSAEFRETAREVKRKLLEGEPFEQPYEQRLVRKDGTIGVVKMSTSLVMVKGQLVGFQNTARDVTEEKKLQENLRFYVQQITRAQEEERKRLARQLHDDVAPHILLLIQRLDAVASLTRPKLSAAFRTKLEELRTMGIEALEGVRRCAQDLRPSILDDLGLVAALEWMADNLGKKHGIEAHVEAIGESAALPPGVQLLLFRIAQEALSNIRKYALASKVGVKLQVGGGRIRLTINDNGKGFDFSGQANDLTRSGKLGIAGMYERARLLGGTLELHSEIGKGTEVIANVPLPDSSNGQTAQSQ